MIDGKIYIAPYVLERKGCCLRIIILLALLLMLINSVTIVFCDYLDDRISMIVRDLEYLSDRGVDVSGIVRDLNMAIRLYGENHTDDAMEILSNISSSVGELKSVAGDIYLRNAVARYGAIALILSIPIIAYITIPRIYLYTWFKLHGNWLVEKRGRK